VELAQLSDNVGLDHSVVVAVVVLSVFSQNVVSLYFELFFHELGPSFVLPPRLMLVLTLIVPLQRLSPLEALLLETLANRRHVVLPGAYCRPLSEKGRLEHWFCLSPLSIRSTTGLWVPQNHNIALPRLIWSNCEPIPRLLGLLSKRHEVSNAMQVRRISNWWGSYR
jgi:hypothetical protein